MSDVLRQDYPLVLTTMLKALSDPMRLKTIQDLINDEEGAERHCSSFESLAGMSRSTRSHHIRIIREAGLISIIDKGNVLLAQLRREEIEQQYPGLLNILVSE